MFLLCLLKWTAKFATDICYRNLWCRYTTCTYQPRQKAWSDSTVAFRIHLHLIRVPVVSWETWRNFAVCTFCVADERGLTSPVNSMKVQELSEFTSTWFVFPLCLVKCDVTSLCSLFVLQMNEANIPGKWHEVIIQELSDYTRIWFVLLYPVKCDITLVVDILCADERDMLTSRKMAWSDCT
jgi:hypothetical protein